MKTFFALVLASLMAFAALPTVAFGDSLSIAAWSTGESLSSNNLNSRMTTITNWSTTIANDNIKSSAAIVGSKLDLTSGTGRFSNSTSVTDDAPVFTSAQTWNDAAEVFSGWRLTITNTNSASTSRLIDLRVDSTIIASISRTGQLVLNSQDYASGPRTMMDGAWFNVASATYTDNVTAASGTAPRFIAYSFQRPAVAAGNSSVTTTHAATVFIASAPVAGDNMTLTNRYALWVDQGDVRIGGNVFASGSAHLSGNLYFDSASPKITTGSTALLFRNNADGSELMRLTDGGILALGTTQIGNVAAGEFVIGYAKAIRSVVQAGDDTTQIILHTKNSQGELLIELGGGYGGASFTLIRGVANASLPVSGQVVNNGILTFDTTNNRLVYYTGSARYYLAGTSF